MLKSENILKVISNLKSVLHLADKESQLDMSVARVKTFATCNTPHCHGGWYEVANTRPWRRKRDYNKGAERMALDLGFPNYASLIQWAVLNPSIWGNRHGMAMFHSRQSFYHPTKRRDGAKSLADIIDHWNDVYLRVKAIEDKQNNVTPVYKDITSELAVLPTQEKSDVSSKTKQLSNQK